MPKERPLEGIRVTDFSWVGAGPYTMRFFAELGAEIIRIETRKRPEILRVSPPFKDRVFGIERSGYFSPRNPNKKSISLNMNHPQGREIVVRLLEKSDIVINNFRVGQMEKWKLGYEDVKKIKPDIIYIDMPMQGTFGPHAHYQGFGYTLNGLVGVNFLSGHPDAPFGTGTNYTDHLPVPTQLAFCILAALRHRRKTGEGQYIEVSQFEAGVCAITALAVMDYAVNGRIQQRMGYHHPNAAPHGVYKTKGEWLKYYKEKHLAHEPGEPKEDRKWITIAVFTEEQWEALKKCMGNPAWAEDPRFSTKEGRLANQDELDARIEEWTSGQYGYPLMLKLLEAGVPAGVVHDPKSVTEDLQLQDRGFWTYLDHPEVSFTIYNEPPVIMSKTPINLRTSAPLLGQHTKEVLTEILQMKEEEIKQLEAAGVLD